MNDKPQQQIGKAETTVLPKECDNSMKSLSGVNVGPGVRDDAPPKVGPDGIPNKELVQEERERFEKHRKLTNRNAAGRYIDNETQAQWVGWITRACALRAQLAGKERELLDYKDELRRADKLAEKNERIRELEEALIGLLDTYALQNLDDDEGSIFENAIGPMNKARAALDLGIGRT